MTTLALYRKYRPMLFSDLMAQDHIRDILKNAVRQGKISHAYLFSGPRGTGKTSAARILARAINCEKPDDGEPCNKCTTCKAALDEALTDLIEMDAASHTGVDNVRDLIEKAQFAPTQAKRKVYIIDEVHMLSKPAFNALLKTLEEPPENTHFILATTEPHKILDTIISRCQRFDFHRIAPEHTMELLKKVSAKENLKAEDDALKIISYNAKGSLRDALSLLEQVTLNDEVTMAGVKQILGMASANFVGQFVDAVRGDRVTEALSYISDLLAEGVDLSQFLNEVLLFLREEMLFAVERDLRAEAEGVIRLIDIFLEASYGLKDAVISQLPLEMAIIRACKNTVTAEKAPVKEPEKKVEIKSVEPPKKEVVKEPEGKNAENKTLSAIIATINESSVRAILKGSIMTQDKKNVTIRVNSDFEKSKLEKIENAQSLYEGVRKVFGDGVELKLALKEKSALSANDVSELFGGP